MAIMKLSESHRSKPTAIVFCKGRLASAVPLLNIALNFSALGFAVLIVCGQCDEELRVELEDAGIRIEEASTDRSGPVGATKRLSEWIEFRHKSRPYLQSITPGQIIYIGSADTAISLFGLLPKGRFILHLREFHDQHPHYMLTLRLIAKNAKRVVVPEENRAYLYYNRLSLPAIPIVLPNKPFAHPQTPLLNIDFLGPELVSQLRSKPNVIYQGSLHLERDLSGLLIAMREREDYNLVLMGRDYGMMSRYYTLNSSIIHVPFIRPPLHLNVTSWARIGILTYDIESLNTIYCAPNKIWEFAGFGVPMLCGANLGLRYTVGAFGAGRITDFQDPHKITSDIDEIDKNYLTMSRSAERLYTSVNVIDVLKRIIAD